MKPLIGITCGEITNAMYPWAPFTYAQTHTYVDAIIRAGGVPFLLPITDDERVRKVMFDTCDGIVFSGGNDINPELYGQEVSHLTVDVSLARDAHEKQLLEWSVEADKPTLCICRGMQLLNVIHGGTLYQDIATMLPDALDHDASRRAQDITKLAHRITIEPNSKLGSILPREELVSNALHHQAVHEVGGGLLVAAKADDGIVEALEVPGKKFIVGIQSHPEAVELTIPDWQKLFTAFVAAAKLLKR